MRSLVSLAKGYEKGVRYIYVFLISTFILSTAYSRQSRRLHPLFLLPLKGKKDISGGFSIDDSRNTWTEMIDSWYRNVSYCLTLSFQMFLK